ncbi:hypothetical protein [Colwellia piezophila]|uniref:hypothetical protein n=1 Tax=Colwellia piezophila TaxID=211668 RepID=UPI00036C7632|nr:hypothetical protein [Colwellia piezophila]
MNQNIKKTNLLVALFATSLLSTTAFAAVPKSVLVKAEPVVKTSFVNAAHVSLKFSLAPIKMNFSQQSIDNNLNKQKITANQNKSVTLTRVNLLAE